MEGEKGLIIYKTQWWCEWKEVDTTIGREEIKTCTRQTETKEGI